jgi:hypothetical protein
MSRAQLVFGLGFVALGTVLLLDRADVVDAGQLLSDWWPSLVIVLGLSQFVQRPRHLAAGAFITAVGVALLLWTAGGIDTVSLLWPLVLIGIGLVLLTRRSRGAPEAHVVTDDDVVALLDDRAIRAPEAPLGKLSLTTILGDLSVDLRDAVLERPTTLEVVTIFGEVELTVPVDWQITTSGPQILGTVRIDPPSGAEPTVDGLHLEVVAVFADVTVRRGTAGTAADPGGRGGAAGA